MSPASPGDRIGRKTSIAADATGHLPIPPALNAARIEENMPSTNVTATRARTTDAHSLAWVQATAYTRNFRTGQDRPWRAAIVYPFMISQTLPATMASRVYHHRLETVALVLPHGMNLWKAASALLMLTVCAGAGAVGALAAIAAAPGTIAPVLAALAAPLAWLLTVLWLLPRKAPNEKPATKALARYRRAHRGPTIEAVARASTAPAGAGITFVADLTRDLVSAGARPGLIAATDRHVGLYEKAGYESLEGTRAMAVTG